MVSDATIPPPPPAPPGSPAIPLRPAGAPSARPREESRQAPGAYNFDIIVIGGGPGGYAAGIRAGQLRKRVLCMEK
jgi:dihydrolipoamide dehydrogenase